MSQAHEPAAVSAYFGPSRDREHAVIAETFHPDRGWKRPSFRKRISPSWARKLRREGVTGVALASAGRLADFRIEELTR